MRKQVSSAVKTYSKAKTVAVLWILSAMIPVAMIPTQKWHLTPINYGAMAVFAFIVFLVIRFVRKRLKTETWALSDSAVYIMVPLLIFFFYFFLMLSPGVRR